MSDKKIDKALNTSSEIVDVTPVEKTKPDRLTKDDVEKDYDYTRANLYSLIEKGQEYFLYIITIDCFK